jgi:hypothetical protein
MRGNPSGNLVPECEPRKGANWRLTNWMPKAAARIQQASLDTQSLVLGQSFIPNSPALCKGRIKKVTGVSKHAH